MTSLLAAPGMPETEVWVRPVGDRWQFVVGTRRGSCYSQATMGVPMPAAAALSLLRWHGGQR